MILKTLKEFGGNYSCFTQSGSDVDLVSTVHLEIKNTRSEHFNHSAFGELMHWQ